jgi:hypothetical protein
MSKNADHFATDSKALPRRYGVIEIVVGLRRLKPRYGAYVGRWLT